MKPFCDIELQMEYIMSKVLKGVFWPVPFVALYGEFGRLVSPEVSPSISNQLKKLQKMILEPMGLLKEDKLEKYWKGGYPELLELLTTLEVEVSLLEPMFDLSVKSKLLQTEQELEMTMPNRDNWEDMGADIARASIQQQEIQQLDQDQTSLRNMGISLGNIIAAYGQGHSFSKREKYIGKVDKEYQLFLDDLYRSLDEKVEDSLLAACVFRAVDAISMLVPKDDLDPLKKDLCDNLIMILRDPESYYSFCKKEEIETVDIAIAFSKVCPSFFHMFLDTYLDEFENMAYQDQINFRKCFNLVEDNSGVQLMVAPVIQLGFVQQIPPQKGQNK